MEHIESSSATENVFADWLLHVLVAAHGSTRLLIYVPACLHESYRCVPRAVPLQTAHMWLLLLV